MQQTIQKCRCQRAVIIEDFRPFLEHPICGDDDGTALVSFADDLEQQVSAIFINGEILCMPDFGNTPACHDFEGLAQIIACNGGISSFYFVSSTHLRVKVTIDEPDFYWKKTFG